MDAIDLLRQFIGRQVLGVRRIFFTHGVQIDQTAGPLELTFEANGAIVLDVGEDGEMLSICDGAWQDPFEAPLSSENEAWVAEHGKWTAFDASKEPDYKDLVGKRLNSVRPLRVAGGNVCGARLKFDSRTVDFLGNADDALVFLDEQHDLRLAEMRIYVDEEAG
jgi:hypothetical protein